MSNSNETILVGGGEMGERIRAFDWSQTPLGPITQWPQSLRSAMSILLPSSAPIVLFWGPELTTLYNDPYRAVFGTKHPQQLGMPAWSAWSDIWDTLNPLLRNVIESGEAFWAADYPFFMNRLGFTEETYFDISYNPVRDEEGKVGGIFCIVSDTTGRVLGDRRLRTLRDMGSRTAKTVEEACQVASQVLAENPADLPFALLYLLEKDRPSAHLCAAHGLLETSRYYAPHLSLTDDDAIWPLTSGYPSGHLVSVQLDASSAERQALILPLVSASQLTGFLVAGVSPLISLEHQYRDFFDLVAANISSAIDDARAYEIERQRAEALAELDLAKTTFFNNVSHEFRTPLTLILGPLAELLESNSLSSAEHQSIVLANRNALRLLKLVNSLLDFSRIEASRIEMSYQPVDVCALTTDLASSFRAAVEKAGLQLIVTCDGLDADERLYLDPEMWEKIVLNLLSNAFKHTFAGAIEVRLQMTADAENVQLIVRDTGTGIDADELPHIFDRFYRGRAAQARTFEGTGIGLALVQELVRLHQGTVAVSSQVDAGTTFVVTIPRGYAHLPPERIQAERELQSTAVGALPYIEEAMRWLPGKSDTGEMPVSSLSAPYVPVQRFAAQDTRILIVDDNADMRDYLVRMLGAFWQVDVCPNGEQALARLRTNPPDLLLTDVMMPGMDGLELLRIIRTESALQALPVILLSARAGEEAAIEGLEAGADDYLVKPFSSRELLARVGAQLDMAALREQTELEQRRALTIFTTIGEGYIAVDHDFRYIYVNPKAEEIMLYWLGKHPADYLGKTTWEVVPGLDESEIGSKFRQVMADGVPAHTEAYLPSLGAWFSVRVFKSSDGLSVYYQDVTEQHKAEEREREQIARIAAAEERQRLARDLHDAVNQTLFTANVLAQSLPRLFERTPDKIAGHLQKLGDLNQGAMAEMRTLLVELLPSALERYSLPDLVRQLVDIVRGRTTLEIALDIKNTRSDPLPPAVQVAVYRIAQESLNNVVKHAKANTLAVSLVCQSNRVWLRVADDGRGFDLASTAAGIGLDNMYERSRSVNADLHINGQPGAGTEITVEWRSS